MTTTMFKLTLLFFASMLFGTTLAQELFSSAAQMKLARKKEIMYRLPNLATEQKITVGIVDGYAIFEGDIVLYKEGAPLKDAGISGGNYRWENGIIPYVIAAGHPLTDDIRRAISIVNQQTNLCIRPRTNEQDYVLIINGNGAYSAIGRQGGEQILSYTDGYAFGSIMHELLHTAGMHHEQSRSDRDNYVRIDFQNIQSGAEDNFGKYNTISSCPYDFGSIMHYSLTGFSRNGDRTIIPIVSIPTGISVGQRATLSACDIAGIRNLYPNALGCAFGTEWKNIDVNAALKWVSVGSDGEMYGVNSTDLIWHWNGGNWERLPGALKQISVGNANHIWGVNTQDMVWRWNGRDWERMPGALKNVAVGSDGTVWGVNAQDMIWRWDGRDWERIPGGLKQISVGAANQIWGVNAQDKIFKRQ